MNKIYLDYQEWRTLLFGETGFPNMEIELLNMIINLASNHEIRVILTDEGIPRWVLTYDPVTEKFRETPFLN